jgi:predicted alpha-1,2-mannosidase
MRMTRHGCLILVLGFTLASACGGGSDGPAPADGADAVGGVDAPADVPAAPDAGADLGAPDVPADVPADVPRDVPADVPRDVPADVPRDVPTDVPTVPPPSPRESVDPFIGTGAEAFNVGNAFPGACVPYGMVKVSPDTTATSGRPWVFHCAGYRYQDDRILGISHMHLHGTGVGDYGVVRMTATTGVMDEAKTTERGYRSRFAHDDEVATPGYYAVTLSDPGVRVELTAGPRAAWHRYTFPASADPGVLLFDLGEVNGTGRVPDAGVTIDPDGRTLRGWQHNVGDFSGRYGGFVVYFEARFDRPLDSFGVRDSVGLRDGAAVGEGTPLVAWVAFDPSADRDVEVQVGLSLVSAENAALNLDADLAGETFEAQLALAQAAWDAELGRVEIEGTTADERTIFYTALYHTMMMPTLLTDVTGEFLGVDKRVHTAEGFTYYTDFSLWDTFRTLHPLVELLDPARAADFAQTLTRMAVLAGRAMRWPMGAGETGSMIGSAVDCVLAETWLKGITGFDVDAAWASLLPGSLREGLAEYESLGYVSATQSGSVSKTLEYAFEDWCLANLGAALGETAAAQRFAARALSYRNLWDPQTQFFRPRHPDGSFVEPFNPVAFEGAYTEASAWQYSWFVPHDVPGLAALFGSAQAMVAKLDELFARTADSFVFHVPGPYYYHGNEPSIQAAYMFLEAGRPDLTQRWVRWILATNYRTDPSGIIGNDDAGTLAAWYVFSALGIYPLPGSDRYFVGSPIVRRAVLHLPGGDLVVTAPGNGPATPYVAGVRLNGAPLDVPWFHHGDIVGGGTLEFEMAAEPAEWGVWLP